MYTVRGFQSSSQPIIHFGYGDVQKIDSLKIVWPDKTYQILRNLNVNQTLVIEPLNNKLYSYKKEQNTQQLLFEKTTNNLGINYVHVEDNYSDYLRQKLIPYQISDRGPAVSVGDLNGDGTDDIFFGGSKFIASKIYVQNDTIFRLKKYIEIQKDSVKEDIASVIADFNDDGNNDLIIGTGGADFFNQMKPLTNTYYVAKDSSFVEQPFPQLFENTSILLSFDYDHDNDLDIFVGNQSITADYGNKPNGYLLQNENGEFKIANNMPFEDLGMITDALITDFNQDGWEDLLVVGEWMSPRFFENNKGTFKEMFPLKDANLNGLWQAVISFDIDSDGDLDYLLGNWGTNTKFKASVDHPMRMYYGDLDKNGATETVLSIFKDDADYPVDGLIELSSQLVSLRKKFSTYKSFAGKPIDEVLGPEMISNARIEEVHTLQSGYLKNDMGTFSFIPFNFELQVSPIMSFLEFDFDNNDKTEVLAAGNYFGVKPYHGRFDSFPGAMISSPDDMQLTNALGLDLTGKSIRHVNIINLKDKAYLLLTFNNDKAQVYTILKQ